MSPSPRRFRYLADPVCITSVVLYALNRFVLKPHHIGGWLTHGYLNDVLCLPLFVPMILYAQRLLHIRPHDRYPRWWEIAQHGVIITIVFQLILPRYPRYFITAGDPYDIIAYATGGVLAAVFWHLQSC